MLVALTVVAVVCWSIVSVVLLVERSILRARLKWYRSDFYSEFDARKKLAKDLRASHELNRRLQEVVNQLRQESDIKARRMQNAVRFVSDSIDDWRNSVDRMPRRFDIDSA